MGEFNRKQRSAAVSLLNWVADCALEFSTDPSSKVGACPWAGDTDGTTSVYCNRPMDGRFPLVGCSNEERHKRSLHAEEQAAKKGQYVVAPWAACRSCARRLVVAGSEGLIRSKTVMDWYRRVHTKWTSSIEEGDDLLRYFGKPIVELETPGIKVFIHGEYHVLD